MKRRDSNPKQPLGALRQSDWNFLNLIKKIPSIAVQGYGPNGIVLYWNKGSELLYGYTEKEAVGRNIIDLIIPAKMRQDVALSLRQMAEMGQPIPPLERSLERIDRSRVSVFSSYAVVPGRNIEPKIYCFDVDLVKLTKHEKEPDDLYRLLRTHGNVLNAIIFADNESALLSEVCRIITEDCDQAMVWIGFAENDAGKKVQPVAQAGFDEGYLETIDITWADTDLGHGPVGTAIRNGKLNICQNIATDPRMVPWREQALNRGYASIIALPLKNNEYVFGVIAIYGTRPYAFSGNEVLSLEKIANALAYGLMAFRHQIASQKAKDALHKNESRSRLLSKTAGRLLASENPQEIVNDLCLEIMNYLDCQLFLNFLVDQDDGSLRLNSWAGIPVEEAKKIEYLQYYEGICDGLQLKNSPVAAAREITTSSSPIIKIVKPNGIQAYACLPLLVENRLIGTIIFGTTTRSVFSSQDLTLLKTIADQIATTLERVRLVGELKKSNDELERRVEIRTAELSASERKYRNLSLEFQTLLNAISDTLILISPDMEILWTNNTNNYKWKIPISQAVGRKCYQLICGSPSHCEACPARRCFESGKEESLVETCDNVVMDKRAFPIKEDGRVNGVILIISDITEKITRHTEMMQAGHLASLGELAAGVAHEINNPITGIINYGQILLNKSEIESLEKNLGERIVKEGERISHIVRSLLTCSRDRRKEKRPSRISAILDDAIVLIHAQIRKEGITLEIDLPEDLPEVNANCQQMQQVFLNIISNARYALNERYPARHTNKRIEIRGETLLGGDFLYARITVTDYGTGIPSKNLSALTKLFFSTKPFGKGTGLGLNITQKIISDHCGKLDFKSTEGNFTSVIIDLPAHSVNDRRRER